jgi:hypothetical protein
MTREEWKNNKSFEQISREMHGLFREWPTQSEVIEGTSGDTQDKSKKNKTE